MNQTDEKTHSSHTVDQHGCCDDAQWDNIQEKSPEVCRCKSCGQLKRTSAFASKGKNRIGKHCKDCDNERRRSKHAPKREDPDWDYIKIIFEAEQAYKASPLAELVWSILTDQKIIGFDANNTKDETLDSMLNRRSAIDGII